MSTRYQGLLERYYIGQYPREVKLVSHDATGLKVVDTVARGGDVEGISARALGIDGTPVAFDGELYTNVTHIEHAPGEYSNGFINLVTDGVDDE